MPRTFQIGDRVGYTAKFCRSIQADYDTANRRGTVVAILPHPRMSRVTITWDDTGEPSNALTTNVARLDSAAFTA